MRASRTPSPSCRCSCRAWATGASPSSAPSYGEGSPEKSAKVRFLAYLSAILLALLCGVLLFVLRGVIGPMFGSSEEVARDVAAVLPVFLFGLLFYAFSRVATAGFYATERTLFSYLSVYSEARAHARPALHPPRILGTLR